MQEREPKLNEAGKQVPPGPRIEREKKTLEAMISIYCRGKHRGKTLCPDCRELSDYALKRLDACPFGENKPVCAKCPVHCYKPVMREKIKDVMRYSGPRMAYRHPVLALLHFVDNKTRRAVPSR